MSGEQGGRSFSLIRRAPNKNRARSREGEECTLAVGVSYNNVLLTRTNRPGEKGCGKIVARFL